MRAVIKKWLGLAVVPLAICMGLGFTQHVAAACSPATDPVGHCAGQGYFNPGDGPQYNGLGQVVECGFSSDSYCNFEGIIPQSGVTKISFDSGSVVNKQSLISFIEGKASGSGRDATGAQFIIQLIRGGTDFSRPSAAAITDFENRIKDPDIEIVYSASQDWGHWNSGYMKGVADDDAFIYEPGSSSALVFRSKSKGTIYFMLKINCANPIGSLPGLPKGATGDINGINVDSTSGASINASFNPTVTATSSGGSTNAVYNNGAFWADGLSVLAPFTTYNVSVPSSYTYGGKTYTPVRSTFCDSTDHPGCDSGLPTASGAPDVIYTNGARTQDIHLKPGHIINMRWFWQVGVCTGPSCGGPPLACPMVPGQDVTKVSVPLADVASKNNPDTWDLNGTRYYSSPTPPAPPYTIVYTHRYGASYTINSARDHDNSSISVPYAQPSPAGSSTGYLDFSNVINTYPYDPNSVDVTYSESYVSTQSTTTVDKDGNSTTSPSTPGPSGSWSGSTTGNLGECYPIHFNVDTATGNSSSLNSYENPSAASLASTVTVHLWGEQNGSKRGTLSVNGLNDAVSYTIRHVDGTTASLGASTSVSTSCGGGGNINCEGTAGPNTSVNVRVGSAINQLRPGDIVCATFTISPQKGDADSGGTIQNGQAGTSPPSGSITSSAVCSSPVINEPYFKVFGGDISAGDTFDQVQNGIKLGCVASAAAASANVYGWNTAGSSAYAPNPYTGDASDAYAGAGAQFSLMAINNINGAASGQNNPNAANAPSNTQGNGLSFANAGTNPAGGMFATSFGTAPACIPDFYADKPSGISNLPGSNVNGADGAYSLSSGTITGGTIGAGKHVVVYATGNVNITRNITFANGSYAITDIPSFVLVVKGNINISNNVTQLDGIYIAQPTSPATPADGTLTDCLEASADRTNLWSACGNPLTVNGSFIANKVYLLRTGTSDTGSYNENASIRAAHPAESNSLSGTMTQDAVMSASCASGVPDASGMCPAQYNPGSPGSGPGPWTYAGSYTMQPGDDCYNAGCSGCQVSGNFESCVSGNTVTYYTRSPGSAGSPPYYSCPGGGSPTPSHQCPATATWKCPDGSTAPPSHKCTINVTPTHASEVFNYNPAFWLTLSLQNVSSQNALKYDSITSLPPVL